MVIFNLKIIMPVLLGIIIFIEKNAIKKILLVILITFEAILISI